VFAGACSLDRGVERERIGLASELFVMPMRSARCLIADRYR